jgi:hypothetical protein
LLIHVDGGPVLIGPGILNDDRPIIVQGPSLVRVLNHPHRHFIDTSALDALAEMACISARRRSIAPAR